MCFISFRLALLSSTVSLLFDLFFIIVVALLIFFSLVFSLPPSPFLRPLSLIRFSTWFCSFVSLCARACMCLHIYAHSINSRSFSACLRKYQKQCMTSIKYTHIYSMCVCLWRCDMGHGTSANKLSLLRIAYKCLLNHGFWHNIFVLVAFPSSASKVSDKQKIHRPSIVFLFFLWPIHNTCSRIHSEPTPFTDRCNYCVVASLGEFIGSQALLLPQTWESRSFCMVYVTNAATLAYSGCLFH